MLEDSTLSQLEKKVEGKQRGNIWPGSKDTGLVSMFCFSGVAKDVNLVEASVSLVQKHQI